MNVRPLAQGFSSRPTLRWRGVRREDREKLWDGAFTGRAIFDVVGSIAVLQQRRARPTTSQVATSGSAITEDRVDSTEPHRSQTTDRRVPLRSASKCVATSPQDTDSKVIRRPFRAVFRIPLSEFRIVRRARRPPPVQWAYPLRGNRRAHPFPQPPSADRRQHHRDA
jgi:hypothetical protein